MVCVSRSLFPPFAKRVCLRLMVRAWDEGVSTMQPRGEGKEGAGCGRHLHGAPFEAKWPAQTGYTVRLEGSGFEINSGHILHCVGPDRHLRRGWSGTRTRHGERSYDVECLLTALLLLCLQMAHRVSAAPLHGSRQCAATTDLSSFGERTDS